MSNQTLSSRLNVGVANLVTQSSSGLVQSAGQLLGTNTNDSASAGNVGQIISANATAVAVDVTINVTTITLTAGDWDVSALAVYNGTSGATLMTAAISANSGSYTGCTSGVDKSFSMVNSTSGGGSVCIPKKTVQVANGNTKQLWLVCSYDSGTHNTDGSLIARRVR